MRLQNRKALVTGASRGVGFATALELSRRGAKVGRDMRALLLTYMMSASKCASTHMRES